MTLTARVKNMKCIFGCRLALVPLLLVLACQIGCTTIAMGKKGELPLGSAGASSKSYTVEVVSPYSKGQVHRGPITEGLTIQSALDASGVLKTHRNPVLTVYRKLPDGAGTLKLACEFQPGKRLVKYEQDYALHAGDRIIVEPKPNPLERLFDSR